MFSLKSTKIHPILDHLNSPRFNDVVIHGCSGPGIETSRFMVSSLSPLLHSVLVDEPPALQTSIIVVDTSEESVKHLFQFMADAEINLNETDYQSLLELMLLLGIDCTDKCSLVPEVSQDAFEKYWFLETETDESNWKLDREEIGHENGLKMECAGVNNEIEHHKDRGNEMNKRGENATEQPEVVHSCEHCDKCFSAVEFLRKHVKACHSQGTFRCVKCDYSSNQKSRLQTHIALVHEKALKHPCDICSKMFSIASNMQVHRNAVHFKVKNFTCDWCEESFARKQELDTHRRKHTGEKPYICGICGQSFSQSTSLKHHVKSHKAG